MQLYDYIINEINESKGEHVAYVTKNTGKLEALHITLVENCDVAGSTTRVYGIHPIGVHNLPDNIDVVLYENKETSEDHLLKHVKFSKKFQIFEVGANNKLDLTYAEDKTGNL